MRNYLILVCIIAIFTFTACVGNRLKARLLQVESSQLQMLQTIIPKLFFVDQSGHPGNQYVAIKTMNNTFLSCSNAGQLSADRMNITKNELWTPELQQDKRIALKASNGKYLGIDNQNFRCNFDSNSTNTLIHFVRNPQISESVSSSNMTSANMTSGNMTSVNRTSSEMMAGNVTSSDASNQTIALKFDNGYLGIKNNLAMLFPNLVQYAIFHPPMNQTSSS